MQARSRAARSPAAPRAPGGRATRPSRSRRGPRDRDQPPAGPAPRPPARCAGAAGRRSRSAPRCRATARRARAPAGSCAPSARSTRTSPAPRPRRARGHRAGGARARTPTARSAGRGARMPLRRRRRCGGSARRRSTRPRTQGSWSPFAGVRARHGSAAARSPHSELRSRPRVGFARRAEILSETCQSPNTFRERPLQVHTTRLHGGNPDMRKLLTATIGVAALAAAVTALAATVKVSITDTGFTPKNVTVTAGDTVTWTNNGKNNHQVVATTGAFASPVLRPGQSYSFKPTGQGTINYRDALNPSLSGSIKVNAP